MFRRMLCLLCAALILASAVPACSEPAAECCSYDFDLTFFLNADSFPELLRTRAAGYASLVNRLGLRGKLSWSNATQSVDLDASLYFTDDPSLAYPFHLYGTESRIFFTSPLINNEVILLNMTALMEFSIKAKNTLGIPLSYVALLFPYTTKSAFNAFAWSWQDIIGTFRKKGKVTIKQFRKLSDLWADELVNNGLLHWWITGVAGGSESPAAFETEMNSLPQYYENVTSGKPLTVSVSSGSEIWKNASGDTLFSRQESDDALSLCLSLPASGNGYVPFFSFLRQYQDQSVSFSVEASVRRDTSVEPVNVSSSGSSGPDDEYDYDYDDESYGDYDGDDDYGDWDSESEEESGYGLKENLTAADLPELMLDFRAAAFGLPRELPSDSSFSMSVSVLGTLYPNYAFRLSGETKKDGAVALSLSKAYSGNAEPVEILRCTGSFLPSAVPMDVPDYWSESLENVYNVFSFDEQKLAAFNSKVITPLIRSVFSFVAAAPTSACQSFLDDLTDSGILDMLLD